MKRIFTLLLALVMTLALAAPVFAEEEEAAPAPEYRLVSVSFDGYTEYTFAYDQGGWLPTAVEHTSTGEVLVTASYDDAGRVISLEDVLSGAAYTYEYNENGDVLASGTHFNEMYSADGTMTTFDTNTTRTYDENGNCIRTERISGYGGELYTTISEFTYDDAGNVLHEEETYEDGTTAHTTEYTYDDAGNRLHSETTYRDGSSSKTEYTYDDMGNVLHEETMSSDGSVSAYEYTYDEAGNKLSETYYSDGEKSRETTYVYDDAGRVVQEDYTSDDVSRSTKYIYTPLLTFWLREDSDDGSVMYDLRDSEGEVIFSVGESYTSEPQFTYDDNGYVTQIDFSWNEYDHSMVFTYEPVA